MGALFPRRFALEHIVNALSLQGLYATLIEQWLPDLRAARDRSTRAAAIGQSGKQHLHIGDYDTALKYLQDSLALRQEIGDKAGLCVTLFNIGHIQRQNGQQQQALASWVRVYRITRPMNQANVLEALRGLAGQLGLPGGGLEAWEALSQAMDAAE